MKLIREQRLNRFEIKKSRPYYVPILAVERWYLTFVRFRVEELKARECPIVMDVEEHFFSRTDGYATMFADLRSG